MTTLAGLGFLGQLSILYYIPILLLRLCGYSKFCIRKDRDRVKGAIKLLNDTTYSSSSVYEYGKTRPTGVFIGWKCIGYYVDGTNDDFETQVVIFTSDKYFKEVLEKSVVPCETLSLTDSPLQPNIKSMPKSLVEIWNRRGGYSNMYYNSFKVDLSNITPIGEQQYVVDDIIQQYKLKERLIVFLHGSTGTGKSTVGILVAKELRGSYCHDFNPTEPGDSFMNFIRDTRRDDHDYSEGNSGPVVVVIEEIDTLIRTVHNGNTIRHKNVTTSVHNKATFNTFLDDMVFHKRIIVIMTSNTSKEEIDLLDPSYLRMGRLNQHYSMMKPIIPA
jgi:hypothetical protein